MMKVVVIIPAYNEQDAILNTVQDLKDNAPFVDYLVINDCSKDKTKEVLEENNIPHLNLPINLGIGGGVQTGYKWAAKHDYDIAIQFDGDGQHDAKYLKNLVEEIKAGADIAIGSRFVQKNKEGFKSSVTRRFGINFLSAEIKLLCGTRVKDVTSGMRAVNKKMIKYYAENYAQDYPEPEAIITGALNGARIVEVPVEMRERQSGKSSINPIKSVYYMIKVSIAILISRITTKKVKK